MYVKLIFRINRSISGIYVLSRSKQKKQSKLKRNKKKKETIFHLIPKGTTSSCHLFLRQFSIKFQLNFCVIFRQKLILFFIALISFFRNQIFSRNIS